MLVSEGYKHLLGRILGWGASLNRFEFPQGYAPVPTPARHYINTFLDRHAPDVRGRVVEFGPPFYRDRFKPQSSSYDVWNLQDDPGSTIVADLQGTNLLPESFDTFICTHVLCSIEDPRRAVDEMHRLLAPGGMALVTVPALLQNYAPHPGDFWRMTVDSLRSLFRDWRQVDLSTYGNAATAAGSPQYLMTYHFSKAVLNRHDPDCPSIVACVARK